MSHRPRRSLSPEQVAALKWVEWRMRDGNLRAHAIDPDSKQRMRDGKRTGARRSFAGTVILATAQPAQNNTKRDPYCVRIISQLANNWLQDNDSPSVAYHYSGPEKFAGAAVRVCLKWCAANRERSRLPSANYVLMVRESVLTVYLYCAGTEREAVLTQTL